MQTTLTAGQYIVYSLLGICVVFAVLVLLMVVIKLFSLAFNPRQPKHKDVEPDHFASNFALAPDFPLAPGSAGELALYDTDPRDAAMVMAIVADELGKPINELRFLSIKEVKK